jgi:hypothetical protein
MATGALSIAGRFDMLRPSRKPPPPTARTAAKLPASTKRLDRSLGSSIEALSSRFVRWLQTSSTSGAQRLTGWTMANLCADVPATAVDRNCALTRSSRSVFLLRSLRH